MRLIIDHHLKKTIVKKWFYNKKFSLSFSRPQHIPWQFNDVDARSTETIDINGKHGEAKSNQRNADDSHQAAKWRDTSLCRVWHGGKAELHAQLSKIGRAIQSVCQERYGWHKHDAPSSGNEGNQLFPKCEATVSYEYARFVSLKELNYNVYYVPF